MPPGNVRLWSTVLLLGLLSFPAFAQEPGQVRENAENTEMPSPEFLEFLGDWETEDGEWIDPEELEQISLTGQEKEYDDDKQQ